MLSIVAMAFSLGFLNPANIKLPQVKMPFAGHQRQVDVSSVHKAGWTVTVRHDNFTGLTSCSLRSRSVEYHNGVVIFRLGASVDTDNAWFRIDNSPARKAQEVTIQDQDLGYFAGRGPIDNPSNGEVGLPRSALDGARQVTVRATQRSSPRTFDLTTLPAALALAKAHGCAVEQL